MATIALLALNYSRACLAGKFITLDYYIISFNFCRRRIKLTRSTVLLLAAPDTDGFAWSTNEATRRI